MSLTLTREQEAKLQRKAARMGKPVEVVLNELLEEQEQQPFVAFPLSALPEEQRAEEEEYVEPHLVNKGGLWVIAGGRKVSVEDVQRDLEEMREERIRSFFPETSNTPEKNENPS